MPGLESPLSKLVRDENEVSIEPQRDVGVPGPQFVRRNMSKKSIKILLLVEDNPGDARLLREMFSEQGLHKTELTHVESMSEAEKHLAERAYDIILLDLGLPDAQGLAAVRRARIAAPRVPLVVLTGSDDETLASQALAGRRARLSGQRPDRCAGPSAGAALCSRAQDHGGGVVRGKGTRPGHA